MAASALTAALAGKEPTELAPPARLRLDPKAFPCLAGVAGGVPALVGDGLGELISGYEKLDLRGDKLAGSAPTAGLLSDGSAAVREKGTWGRGMWGWAARRVIEARAHD